MGFDLIKKFFITQKKTFGEYFIDGLILLFFNLIFCFKFFNKDFIFQGDVFHHLFMHNYPEFINIGWNPHEFGYLGWYPIIGAMFPLNLLMHFILNIFTNNSPDVTLTFLQINAVISLFLLSFFTYILFRYLERSRIGSIIGTIIVTFTGFHIQASVREFNLFF